MNKKDDDSDSESLISNNDNEQNEESDVDSDGEEVNAEEEELKENIIKFVEIANLIKEKQEQKKKEINELNEQKKDMEEKLINYMEKNNKSKISVGNQGNIVINKYRNKEPIKKEYFTKSIRRKLDELKKTDKTFKKIDQEKFCEEIYNYLEEERPIKERKNLKFNRPRKN
jgi:single-stranded DNA-specific DHH superfamily exonuclease